MSDPFLLCLNTSTIRPASLRDKIRIAGEAGYGAIELWGDDLTAHENAGGTLSEVRGWLKDAGLQAPSVIAVSNWMDSREGDEKKRAFAEVRRRMEQGAAIGSRHIVASPVPDNDELDMVRAAARYRDLLVMGREIGVTPAMEFLGFFHNVYRLDQALAIAKAAEHPDACIVLDPFHLYRGGSGFDEIAAIPAKMIAICHFNDAPADPPRQEQGDKDRVYPGDGILPLAKMLGDLVRNGYQGALSLELFNPAYWANDPESVARTGLAKTREVLAKIPGV
ncbi:MAG TPA: sugar phosphate isomerase/epimerase family protein [Armatimonadota bacterium]|nr:sugar phosphate isomerase/epimerase family protein [Armatimonadota bacterium]